MSNSDNGIFGSKTTEGIGPQIVVFSLNMRPLTCGHGLRLDHLRATFCHKRGNFRLHFLLSRLVGFGRLRYPGRHRHPNFQKHLFQSRRRTDAWQPRRFLAGIDKIMRRIRRDMDRLSRPHDRFFAPESGFNLAFHDRK